MPDGASTPLCPHCQWQLRDPAQAFCTRCGLALRQPCPNCASSLATPDAEFTECAVCQGSFWGCRECGRLYHLDRTSCLNSYCPSLGLFWTASFGGDSWDGRRGHHSVAVAAPSTLSSPLPGWLGGGGGERRFPSLHHSGLLISVQESGVLEMWAERGAPRHAEGDEFRETSVCLVRLDLGEPATGAPLLHRDEVVVLGSSSLCLLELTSNPSLGGRLELGNRRGPLQALSLSQTLVLVSPDAVWEVDVASRTVLHRLDVSLATDLEPVSDGTERVLLSRADGSFFLYCAGGECLDVGSPGFGSAPEWAFYSDRFLLLWRNQLAYLDDDGVLRSRELPAALVTRPVYDRDSQRLTVLLSDGTIRTCSSSGERFSFVGDMPGVPTTAPLRVGERVYYGSEGRYLCCDEEALLPRLNSPPWGELSYANGRLFGTTREGGLFTFCL